jgi:hypothetical protein
LLRPEVEEASCQIMTLIEAGGPEMLPDPHAPSAADALPAKESPASMARLAATFVDSHDGWIDDNVAFAKDWAFELASISVPVSIWYGDKDDRSRKQAAHLGEAIAGAEIHEHAGGHLQNDEAYRKMLTWLQA